MKNICPHVNKCKSLKCRHRQLHEAQYKEAGVHEPQVNLCDIEIKRLFGKQ